MVDDHSGTLLSCQGAGALRIHRAVPSRHLEHARDVWVWLPPSYAEAPDRRYPVLYMHDGQQVFDPATSTHGVAWGVDVAATRLIERGAIRELIVVAVSSTEARLEEYDAGALGPRYARFLLRELKPWVDRTYRTRPGRDDTAIAGSSMGGVFSFYMAWNFPHLLGAAACLSPAFERHGRRRVLDQVRSSDITPDVRLYLSCGGGDALERTLLASFREMQDLLTAKRMETGPRLAYRVDEAAEHNEAAWAALTPEWLTFLFGG